MRLKAQRPLCAPVFVRALAPVFVRALARLRPDTQVFLSQDENGVAHCALSLTGQRFSETLALEQLQPLPVDMSESRKRFREAAEPSS